MTSGAGRAPGEAQDTLLRGEPLLDGLEQHVPGSRRHADAVAAYSFALAVEIGLGRSECELIREAARLHEVGKLYLPQWLLAEPPGQLSDSERAQLAAQEELGHRVCVGAGISDEVCAWILHAREHFDGTGPGGLGGEGIPLPSRIIRATCSYATLLRQQPSDAAEAPHETTIAWLRNAGGAELDPALVEGLARVVTRASRPRSGA
jgi:HD-GYP domain-containing protein (c-di-GMP phosphodiesterase class II)